MNDSRQFDELGRLTAALCEGSITADESQRLSELLRGDAAARAFYLDYVSLHGILAWDLSPTGSGIEAKSLVPSFQDAVSDGSLSDLLPLLGDLTIADPVTTRTFSRRNLYWATLGTVTAVCAAAVLAFMTMPRARSPELAGNRLSPVVDEANNQAAITNVVASPSSDLRLISSSGAVRVGSTLSTGDTIELKSGTVELMYASGAKVVLHAPTQFRAGGFDGGFLHRGTLLATVPPQAIGFTVQTATARIVDLGTEFSVEVNNTGATNVQVLQGAVEVGQAKSPVNGASNVPVRVLAGHAVHVDVNGSRAITNVQPTGKLVRTKDLKGIENLDLADVVAGGDGRGSRRGFGIDPTNGRLLMRPDSDYSQLRYLPGDGKYHRVEDRPFIDGVAIPDPSKGPVPLTSTGQAFAGFPQTNNRTFGPVWAGTLPQVPGEGSIRTTFDGRLDYAISPHSVIVFHPNKLITFDLAAIRRVHSKQLPSAFHTVVGVTKLTTETDHTGSADFWVFVDGELRFSRRAMRSNDDPQEVDVPIAKSARFLTLAATDAGDGFNWDWLILGDPQLTLSTAENSSTTNSQASPQQDKTVRDSQ